MLRTVRRSVPLTLVLVLGCQDDPTSPDAAAPPSYSATQVIRAIDLDQGRTGIVNHWARHISDAGWVFVSPDLVWLTPIPLQETQLPTPTNTEEEMSSGRTAPLPQASSGSCSPTATAAGPRVIPSSRPPD